LFPFGDFTLKLKQTGNPKPFMFHICFHTDSKQAEPFHESSHHRFCNQKKDFQGPRKNAALRIQLESAMPQAASTRQVSEQGAGVTQPP